MSELELNPKAIFDLGMLVKQINEFYSESK